MTKHLNVFGDVYDDAEPCFLTTGGDSVFNRVRRQWYSALSIQALATETGHVWQVNEVGVPSDEWIETHGDHGIVWAPGIGPGSLPENTVAPAISGSLVVPALLTCDGGTWTGNPELSYSWQRDGSPIDGALESTYTTQVGLDEGTVITCEVLGSNYAGSDLAVSNELLMNAAAVTTGGGSSDPCPTPTPAPAPVAKPKAKKSPPTPGKG